MVSELSFNKKALTHGNQMVQTFTIFSLFSMAWDGSVNGQCGEKGMFVNWICGREGEWDLKGEGYRQQAL